MQSKALIVWGGWEGHEPRPVADIFASALDARGFQVDMRDTLDVFTDTRVMESVDLVVPVWTMGSITGDELAGVTRAVANGAGIAGCHGGMCDSFRAATEWQFMTGGQWVAHPGNDQVHYRVHICDGESDLMRGLSDFEVRSEQYYLHTDPGNRVLAVTQFPVADGPHVGNGTVSMPVVWTKMYGAGRVFYCSLGHSAAIVRQPEVLEIMTRGMAWAARKR